MHMRMHMHLHMRMRDWTRDSRESVRACVRVERALLTAGRHAWPNTRN